MQTIAFLYVPPHPPISLSFYYKKGITDESPIDKSSLPPPVRPLAIIIRFTDWLIDWLIDWLTDWFYLFTYLFNYLFVYLFIYLLFASCWR